MQSLPIYNGPATDEATRDPKYVKVLDQSRCIGCHACTTACKSENEVPLSVTRTYVKAVDVGEFPDARRNFQVTRCNQCEDAPCVNACPTRAMFVRPDGIVDFDKDSCIGCKACIAACPYDAIFINPEDHSAEKCNFCAHRIDMGLEPACVVVCPVEAILVGDINDPSSKVAQEIGRNPTNVRRPEKDTRPKVHYKGASQATLDPLAAARPEVDIFAWASQYPDADPHHVNSGTPTDPTTLRDRTGDVHSSGNSSAAAILAYDIGHDVPWDWRVSLYTWTKSIAAGLYAVVAVLVLFGVVDPASGLWQWAAPLGGVAFLAITGAVLIWDLEHPERFYFIFTKAHWSSWLVKGGVIIGAYGAILSLHLLVSLLGGGSLQTALAVVGIPAAVLTAVYTAFLFAQAKARDLWQSPLLPPHFAVQAALAGSALALPLAAWLAPDAVATLAWVLTASVAAHVLMVVGEITLPHPTAHARLAAHSMTHGRFARVFWSGLAVTALAGLAPLGTPVAMVAAAFALLGLLAHEHAYVQAGQSVPLA